MAITINAKTSGAGGLETTADNTGNINIQSGGSTVMSISSTGVSVTGSFSQDGAVYSTQPSFRNRIINGDMRVDQRNAGASITPTGSVYTVDRWQGSIAASSKLSFQQSTDAPTGFTNSMLITTVSAYTAGAAEYFSFFQPVEGYNISDLVWGSASAKTVTLSFWIKSSLTGTFSGALQNNGASRSYPFTYTISSANTWEQKSVTIAGDTTGTWLTANNKGMEVHFDLGSGSDRRGTAGAWNSNWNTGTTGSVSLIQTGSATLYITGVQLEVGSTATDFEVLPYDVELARCQRYYQKITGTQYACVGSGNTESGWGNYYVKFTTIMRANPTISQSNLYGFPGGSGAVAVTGIRANYANTSSTLLQLFHTASAGLAVICYIDPSSGYLDMSAEL